MKTLREAALDYAKVFLGTMYRWGGDDPTGFDCSGLMVEILKSVGKLPRDGDWSAAQLAELPWLNLVAAAPLNPGVLLFWNRGAKIGHVEMVWAVAGGTILTIGASGGGSTTTTHVEAARDNAFVKIRPAVSAWVKAVDPFA